MISLILSLKAESSTLFLSTTTWKLSGLSYSISIDSTLKSFPGITREDLPDGYGWASEFAAFTTHTGTHMDAPLHFHPTMNHGEPAWSIDQFPLEFCHFFSLISQTENSVVSQCSGSRRQHHHHGHQDCDPFFHHGILSPFTGRISPVSLCRTSTFWKSSLFLKNFFIFYFRWTATASKGAFRATESIPSASVTSFPSEHMTRRIFDAFTGSVT